MYTKKTTLFLLFFLGIYMKLWAQTGDTTHSLVPVAVDSTIINTPKSYVIQGKVTDIATGLGISGAVVQFLHTTEGATTDPDGAFIFSVDSLPTLALRIEALGFKSRNINLKRNNYEVKLSIDLDRSSKMLYEVVVGGKAEDPALVLMRHVVQRKPYNNPDKADNYRYLAYNRLEADLLHVTKKQFQKVPFLKNFSFVYDNFDTVSEAVPFLPLYMTETISDFFFRRKPKKQREFIIGSMAKGVNNESITKYLGTLYQNVNIYRNHIPIFDKKYISPVNDNGPFYYKYKIIDTQQAYGHDVFIVKFTPRRAGENCFTGYIKIVDSSYAVSSIEMNVSNLSNLNWVDKVTIQQDFIPVDTFWFVSQDKFIANFTLYSSKKLPGFIGRKTTTFHNIRVNDTANDSVLDDSKWKEDIINTDSAKKRQNNWWLSNRPDTLSRNEANINKTVDSINNMPLAKTYKKAVDVFVSGVYDWHNIELGPYFYIYSRNSIEGNRFRLSLATPRKLKEVHITGFLAYGTLDNKFKYGGTGMWIIKRNPRVYIYGYYIHDLEQTLNYYDQIGSDNIFNSLLRKSGIPWKLAFADEQRLEFYKQYYSNFSHKLILQHRQYDPYRPLPVSGVFYDGKGKPSQVVTSADAGLELRWAYKEKYIDGYYVRRNLGSKYPALDLIVTQGFKGFLNSAYNYQKVRFSVSETINIPPYGKISYNLFSGKDFGKLPYPLLEIQPGNEYNYYNSNAFEMMNQYEFISDKYAGIFIEHNIGSGIFKYIPAVKYLKMRQFWTAKGLVGGLSKENEDLNFNKGYYFRTLHGEPYLELGTGISNILEFMRLDFVWRVTPKPESNETLSKHFGIFVSAYFQF